MTCLNMNGWNVNRYIVDQIIWLCSVVAQNKIDFGKGNEKILPCTQYTICLFFMLVSFLHYLTLILEIVLLVSTLY